MQSTHLDVLFPDASSDKLRRRLNMYFHAGLVARPEAQRASLLEHHGSRAMAYLLTDAGAALVAERRGVRFTLKPDTIKFNQVSHMLGISDVMIASHAACRRSTFVAFEPFADILSRAPMATRTELVPEKWKVDIRYRGIDHTFHQRADGIFAICQSEARAQGDPRAPKYFFFEYDRGTMPIERPDLYQTSMLRKYLCYAETFRSDIHRDRFGMDNMRVLFVTPSRRRADRMIQAFEDHMTGIAYPRLFLFADRPTLLRQEQAFFDYQWRDGKGDEHTLLE